MEEQVKKEKIGSGKIFLIVLLTAIATAGILVAAYFLLIKPSQKNETTAKNNTVSNTIVNEIENTVANTTENATTNNITTNIFENYMEKQLKVTKRFAVSKIEETNDSYILSIYFLKDKIERISKETHDKILNEGATIRFRGREFKFYENHEDIGDEYGYSILTEVSNTGHPESGAIGLVKYYDSETKTYTDDYTFYQYAGKEDVVRDYATTEPIKLTVKKDIKVGNTFEKFEYEKASGKIYVKDYMNELINEDEAYTKNFLQKILVLNPVTKYGECEAYLLDDEVVAIKTYEASGP